MKLLNNIIIRKRIKVLIAALIFLALSLPAPVHAVSLDSHEIKFERIVNARDLGGYKTEDGRRVKKGVLIRSAELSYASAADIRKLKDTYNLGTVIDFRYTTDHKYCPDKKISGVKNINIPAKYAKRTSSSKPRNRYRNLKKKSDKALRSASIRAAGRAGRSYTKALVTSRRSQKKYRKYFEKLLENEDGKGILLHCTYGKDRTGVAAFMTLVALGVDEETAYKEYALTNKYLDKYGHKYYKRGGRGVRTSDLRYSVKLVKRKYGSLRKFMKKAYGLDSAKIRELREMYTE